MGRTGKGGRLPGNIRAGGFGVQQQGRPSGLCKKGFDENSIFAGY
jgi:hypothetical protein